MITGFHDWHCAMALRRMDVGFTATLIHLALKADPDNRERLERAWPGLLDEVKKRHDAPGGAITPDEVEGVDRLRREGKMNVLGEVTIDLLKKER